MLALDNSEHLARTPLNICVGGAIRLFSFCDAIPTLYAIALLTRLKNIGLKISNLIFANPT